MQNKPLHLVVGLGITGSACVRFLYDSDTPIAVIDSRTEPPNLAEFQQNYPDIPLHLGGWDSDFWQQAEVIVLSPGVSREDPVIAACIERKIPVIGEIELFAHAVTKPVIAITGTNGKSTVTSLVGKMIEAAGFKAAIGGNLGKAALDLLAEPEPDYYVLELSSYQLESTESLKPYIASILNINPDHMDRYASFADYAAAKQHIYQGAEIGVFNADDKATQHNLPQKQISFTHAEPNDNQFGLRNSNGTVYLAFGQENLLPVTKLALVGKHNWLNALAALAIGHQLQLPLERMLDSLKQFTGLAHRCQRVALNNNIAWYNDSKATNPAAACAAIEGVAEQINGEVILIAGGQSKEADLSPLKTVCKNHVKKVFAIGDAQAELMDLLAETTDVVAAHSLEEAVQQAQIIAEPGDAVLLAPACASFDMFKDFAARGDAFQKAIHKIFK